MPNCDFYGTTKDHHDLLSWLFSEKTCHAYELYSDFEQPLKQFLSSSDVMAQFERCYTTGQKWHTIYLQLYVLGAGPPFVPCRVSLDPRSCGGATYRYSATGWGLVQLYLTQPTSDGLRNSHTNHNTQRRAEAWSTSEGSNDATCWDFKRITAFSSRLNREIRKRAVGKLRSHPVLPGALELWESGISLVPYKPTDFTIQLVQKA